MSIKTRELHPHNERSGVTKWFRDAWHGKSPFMIRKKAVTGYVNAVTRRKVTIRINAILASASTIKIGVMGDTSVRMDDPKYRSEFEFVARIYKSKSRDFIKAYEVELIKKYKVSHPEKVLNISEALASRLTTYNGFYYIYVVYNAQ